MTEFVKNLEEEEQAILIRFLQNLVDPKSPVTVDNFMGTIGTASKKLHGKIKNVICQLQWKILMFEPEAKYFLHQVFHEGIGLLRTAKKSKNTLDNKRFIGIFLDVTNKLTEQFFQLSAKNQEAIKSAFPGLFKLTQELKEIHSRLKPWEGNSMFR
ncbi:unnamed protein product [Dracunculus medinensis]|uniref:Fatty-acid and retinol-binding protein 1 n=1 Tax=Dracunculus medinensis TaxID=318479 RepID=A0A0N4U8X9_DRAME|nr:unnamed protein product [Dracunculus medinensis]